jgi:hypothetical protein
MQVACEPRPSIKVKGVAELLEVFRPDNFEGTSRLYIH